MTISYNWLCDYLPAHVSPEKLSQILTGVGLEVESMEKYESVKGGLNGLVVGEVLVCEKHPNADKLKLTRVDVGAESPLQIVCGAPNVAVGQKVIVAKPGVTIYPLKGAPLTLAIAKIRGVESFGMICAKDEIGLGEDHAGIVVLENGAVVGTLVADYFKPYTDHVFAIGLTPNHMDAMSHFGVARDVSAYLSLHQDREWPARSPFPLNIPGATGPVEISVRIDNTLGCERYSGLCIKNISIGDSPQWLKDRLGAIGVRPISNIVDITNYVLHETGQPLHAFDLAEIRGRQIIVKNLPEGTPFTTLDEKKRTLSSQDLMICDAVGPLCIAGVFGGLDSGIKSTTKDIFLESAYFNPADIRRTSVRHGLRTEAASRFEKGTDISSTVRVLYRTAELVLRICGGEISGAVVDVYPAPRQKPVVELSYAYLTKLSGKKYDPRKVKKILMSLDFEILGENTGSIQAAPPYHKPDVQLGADVVEEIMRIDGLDNIAIPQTILISPSTDKGVIRAGYREKISDYLSGSGFYEILTNSITNTAFFETAELSGSVKMINNLSAELNVLRPSMLHTGLEAVAYNLNRKAANCGFYEFGKTYRTSAVGQYSETEHLCLYSTGYRGEDSWRAKPGKADLFFLKGICNRICALLHLPAPVYLQSENKKFSEFMQWRLNGEVMLELSQVNASVSQTFGIRQPVYFADFYWEKLAGVLNGKIEFTELARQLPVRRDLAVVVDKFLAYGELEKTIRNIGLPKLQDVRLFDIFESDKLGEGKKSMALSLVFLDPDKTLTDEEVETMMNKIIVTLERELRADIRK